MADPWTADVLEQVFHAAVYLAQLPKHPGDTFSLALFHTSPSSSEELRDPAATIWAVDHPGIGILGYRDEAAARIAAGTAGAVLCAPGPWRRATMPETTTLHAWLESLGTPDCMCGYEWKGLSRLYGVSMGRGWVRMDTATDCPHHTEARDAG